MNIVRHSTVPLYQQLASILRQQIDAGKLVPGATLPPESSLTRKYRVSRITTRQALDLLVAEGLIVRKQGKGTYVCPPKIQQNLESLQGFAELMAKHGAEQAMQVIESKSVAACASVTSALKLAPTEQVWRIKRRHLLKNTPIAYAVIYLPDHLGHTFKLAQIRTIPIYTLLTQNAHIKIKRATQVVRALGADQETAAILHVPRGTPLMMIERTTFAEDETPVEYILFYYRGDSYELAVELHRGPKKNILRPADELGQFASDS